MTNTPYSSISQTVSPRWEAPGLVESFRTNSPNDVLMRYARTLNDRHETGDEPLRALDIGAGAGRNAVPLAQAGFQVTCVDLSTPMIQAAKIKRDHEAPPETVQLAISPIAPLPFRDQQFDLIVAHGIWNLSKTDKEFCCGIAEAARVAKPGAGLFLFTFSRHTIPDNAPPVAGEKYIFTQFGDEPQCFLREEEIIRELREVGFACDTSGPLTEYNCPPPPYNAVQRPPVIFESTFTRVP